MKIKSKINVRRIHWFLLILTAGICLASFCYAEEGGELPDLQRESQANMMIDEIRPVPKFNMHDGSEQTAATGAKEIDGILNRTGDGFVIVDGMKINTIADLQVSDIPAGSHVKITVNQSEDAFEIEELEDVPH